MSVDYVVYVSQAKADLTPQDLESILEQSRSYNSANDVTGMLLYAEGRGGRSGSFMQLLEGEADEIETLRKRIFDDTRHHTKIVIERGAKPNRDFSDWSMAFRTTNASELAKYPEFSELGERHFHERCAQGEVKGALEFLCDFWED